MKNQMKHVLLLLIFPLLSVAQSVKGQFSPATDFTYAFLYSATPDGANYVDRGKLDGEGRFEIDLDADLEPGIYKIVYAIPPEENNFDFIYDGKETVAFNFSDASGVEFTQSEENKLWDSYLKSMEMVNQTISNYYTQGKSDQDGFNSIFKVLDDTQKAYEESSEGMLVSAFIKANRPYIPKNYEDLTTYSENLKAHYLSEIDFNNYMLQCSSFLVDRVMAYVFDIVVSPTNTTFKKHIDEVAEAIGTESDTIKTSLLYLIWQRFEALDNHELANYITDRYLLQLANATSNKVIAEQITAYKNTSVGTIAPNFTLDFKRPDGKQINSLHDLSSADYYLLIFWSSACGHCLDELPKIKSLVSDHSNLKVIAFGLETSKADWARAIEMYPDFIHVLGLEKWENPTATTYGISATPTYFLLDKNKTIIAKPYEYQDVEEALNGL
jgi:thiol-disulfide isomerase/thioredoxin